MQKAIKCRDLHAYEDRMMLLCDEYLELVEAEGDDISKEAVDVGVCAMIVWDGAEPGDRDDGR